MKRRSFLKQTVAGMLLLAATLLPYGLSRLMSPAIHRPSRNYLRPPGAIADDSGFIAACIGCGLCGEVCPPRCIKFHARDGADNVNTPYINPDEKACTLCGRCMDVCPTNALAKTSITEIRMGVAEIDRSACYPWVDRGICGACVSVCPLGDKAIGFKMWNQYRPVVRDGCVGCGLCVEVCPHPSKPIWVLDPNHDNSSKKAA